MAGVAVWSFVVGILEFVSDFGWRGRPARVRRAVWPERAFSHGQTRAGCPRHVAGERGATSVEYVLLLITFVLPMMVVLKILLNMLIYSYRMVTYWITLPFP